MLIIIKANKTTHVIRFAFSDSDNPEIKSPKKIYEIILGTPTNPNVMANRNTLI